MCVGSGKKSSNKKSKAASPELAVVKASKKQKTGEIEERDPWWKPPSPGL